MDNQNTHAVNSALFQNLPAGPEREIALKANALRTEDMAVKVYFTPAEMAEMRREYTEKMLAINALEEELARKKTEIMGKMKPLMKESDYALANIRTGHQEVNQQVYLFDDQDAKLMSYYGSDGKLIYSRTLAPTEYQTNVISMAHRTGTND
jgi:hypothetical protein